MVFKQKKKFVRERAVIMRALKNIENLQFEERELKFAQEQLAQVESEMKFLESSLAGAEEEQRELKALIDQNSKLLIESQIDQLGAPILLPH